MDKGIEVSVREGDRRGEWFVPSFGPLRLRVFLGLLFLPYTGMVLAFTVIGAMLAETVHWDRVAALLFIYFLGLGVGAHALDAIGADGVRPWGEIFSRRQLKALALLSLVGAYALGIYYMLAHVPLLWPIAIAEGFFVFAYNLEWFRGRFHTDAWFAFSWGALPVLAGYVMQTNRLSAAVLIVAAAMALLSLVEIQASRPYKQLKRERSHTPQPELPEAEGQQASHARQYELILKSISLGVILLGLGLMVARWNG